MSEVDKLVSKITEAIGKAGGEAARVWPDMGASLAFSASPWVAFGAFLFLLFGCISAWSLRQAIRYKETDPYDDGRMVPISGVIVGLILMLAGSIVVLTNLTPAIYPEVALIRSLIGR